MSVRPTCRSRAPNASSGALVAEGARLARVLAAGMQLGSARAAPCPTSGFLPEGKPDGTAPGCDPEDDQAKPGSKRGRAECDCAICTEPLSESGENGAPYIFSETCKHQFHGRCIFGWVRAGSTRCPTCRREIPLEDRQAITNKYTSGLDLVDRVRQDPLLLQLVPLDHPDYGKLALEAVKKRGRTLEYVPTERADYRGIALAAVNKHGFALRYVPTDRADYREIAMMAVNKIGWALEFVPTDRSDYGEIALVAVNKDGWALMFVPTDLSNYGEIAMVAVRNNGKALESVPTDRADYGEIALAAVRKDGWALMYVPKDRPDYGEIVSASRE